MNAAHIGVHIPCKRGGGRKRGLFGNLIWPFFGRSVTRVSGSVLAPSFSFCIRRRILLFEIAISHRSFARRQRAAAANEQPIIRTVFQIRAYGTSTV